VRNSGKDEFTQGNKKGSINIPLDSLKTRINELDTTKPIIISSYSQVCPNILNLVLTR
jgi:rhodanese-related sulfurtransferase